MNPLFIALIALALVACGFVAALWVAQRRASYVKFLRREQKDLVDTERRMFLYLHELGAAIAGQKEGISLYKIIVEGAVRVTESCGGALYTFDDASGSLVPRFISGESAPLTPLSEQTLTQATVNPSSLLSALRLQRVSGTGSLLGAVFTGQKSEHIPDIIADTRLSEGRANTFQAGSGALIGPLTSGNRRMGILAVTQPNTTHVYDSYDLEIFSAIAEQSAFALASAAAHLEMAKKRKLDEELKNASEVQRILLPEKAPEIKGFTLHAKNLPARILSGDFYDYVSPDIGKLGAVIADVSGKGFPAALVASTCRSALQAHAQAQASPSSVLSAVNRQIFDDIKVDMFVSAIYLILDQATGTIRLARAGHPEPMVWRQTPAIVETLQSPGLGLGIDQGDVFDRVTKDISLTLQSGDCLLVYTDGVSEAENAEGDEFGEDRIRQLLATHASEGPVAVIDAVLGAVASFCGGSAPSDDITLVALQRE